MAPGDKGYYIIIIDEHVTVATLRRLLESERHRAPILIDLDHVAAPTQVEIVLPPVISKPNYPARERTRGFLDSIQRKRERRK